MFVAVACSVLALAGCTADTSYDYVPCASASDCHGAARCHTITWRDGSGGLCTADCAHDGECPHAGRCLDVNASGAFECFEPCAVDADCPPRFVCQPITTGGSVCLPGP
jgi:hypothetical protein